MGKEPLVGKEGRGGETPPSGLTGEGGMWRGKVGAGDLGRAWSFPHVLPSCQTGFFLPCVGGTEGTPCLPFPQHTGGGQAAQTSSLCISKVAHTEAPLPSFSSCFTFRAAL